jgi:acetamidase/formamidase
VVKVRQLQAERVHFTWSRLHNPVVRVAPGAELEVWTRDGFDGQLEGLDSGALGDSLTALDFRRIAPLTGPVYIEGSIPGDTVAVTIKALTPIGPGWTVIWPAWCGFDYHRPEGVPISATLVRFSPAELGTGSHVSIGPARVRLAPMLGIVGTAPASGEFATLPPRSFGGNMDFKAVSAGSTVYLPVFVDGALVSFGDGHAAQGDGEVCTTGLECAMRAIIGIDIVTGWRIAEPQVETPQAYHVTAYGRDLDEAARKAISYMHEYLVSRRGISPADAYVLMSLAGDLGVNQVVNLPHVGARFSLPKDALP